MSKLLQALTGIEQTSATTLSFPSRPPVTRGLSDPPSYIVQLLLCGVAGLKWTKGDKSAWEVNVTFRGIEYHLSDWKRSTWSIYAYEDNNEVRNTAVKLQHKIASAGHLLNKALQPRFQKQVDDSDFFLKNSYPLVRRPYEYFRQVLEEQLAKLEELIHSPLPEEPSVINQNPNQGLITPMPALTSHLNKIIKAKMNVSHTASAMLVFFFSYTELLLDALFAFETNKEMSYFDFRKKSWADRFNKMLPNSTDKTLHSIYDRLLENKRTMRDVILHGFGSELALLVPYGNLGLVPVSYTNLVDGLMFSWNPIEESDAYDMLKTLQDFDDWVAGNDRIWYVHKYTEHCFEIPFNSREVERIKNWMVSREYFLQALEDENDRYELYSEDY